MTQASLFSDLPEDGVAEDTFHMKRNTRQLLPNREYIEPMLDHIRRAGPKGILLKELMDYGIARRWWQADVQKHAGEKLGRPFWDYGVIVPPNNRVGLRGKRAIHPDFVNPITLKGDD
jgi:hypothetical protein